MIENPGLVKPKVVSVTVKMVSTLNPSVATLQATLPSIQNAMKLELPPDVLANSIAPFLSLVNQWSTQIPAMLEVSGPNSAANLVFAIRKELFNAPHYTHSVLGIPASSLPTPFQEFLNFIFKLIEAQRSDKDKVLSKVLFISF